MHLCYRICGPCQVHELCSVHGQFGHYGDFNEVGWARSLPKLTGSLSWWALKNAFVRLSAGLFG